MKPERIQAKMKPERIQARWEELRARIANPPPEEKMKPERIQQKLEKLPGWQEGRRGLERTFVLPSPASTRSFVGLLLDFGEALGFTPRIVIDAPRVTVRVATGEGEGVTPLDFEVAEVLGLQVIESEQPETP